MRSLTPGCAGGSKDDAWRAAYDRDYAPFDPRRPLRVPTHALHIQLTVEANFLLVAVRNVIRAHDRLPDDLQTTMGDLDVLKDLRDLTEHFDELEGRAAASLSVNHPDVLPDAFAHSSKEIWIGGHHGVPLSRVRAWLERVWIALCASLRTSGAEVPDDLMRSCVLGDDDLEWPAERLRYHWSIPQLPEQEWPREDMPEPLARLIDARFRSLRERDVTD